MSSNRYYFVHFTYPQVSTSFWALASCISTASCMIFAKCTLRLKLRCNDCNYGRRVLIHTRTHRWLIRQCHSARPSLRRRRSSVSPRHPTSATSSPWSRSRWSEAFLTTLRPRFDESMTMHAMFSPHHQIGCQNRLAYKEDWRVFPCKVRLGRACLPLHLGIWPYHDWAQHPRGRHAAFRG